MYTFFPVCFYIKMKKTGINKKVEISMKKVRNLFITSCLVSSLAAAACGAVVEKAAPQPAVQQPAQQTATKPTQPASPTAPQPPQQPARSPVPNAIVYYIDGMEKAQVKEDITYKILPNGESLKLDVYLPQEAVKGQKYPAVIFVHGRARNPVNLKSRGQYVSWGQLIAKSGMAAITFNYRLTNYENTQESYQDIKDLIAYVRKNADSLQIDKDRLAIITFSASGVAGLYMPLKERPPFIKAMVSYYNWLDLEDMRAYNEPAVFEKLNEFAPVTHLQREPEKIAPMLIVKAGKDSEQINKTIDNFVKTAQEKKAKIELLVHPEGDHGFDFENDDDTSREIIKRTVAFLAKHLLKE
jgi:acetyl esterase/lipase